jgi:hypothetical protein
MSFSFWLRNRKRFAPTARRRARTTPHQQANFRPILEVLEDRTVPTIFNLTINPTVDPSGAVNQLIAAMNSANKAGGTNTINLFAGGVYDLTAVNNTTNGANGLPVISSGGQKVDNLTIMGNGDIIERKGTLAFRLFDVAQGASLTLENVTLQGGLASGSGAAADGGAIYNQGTLTLQNTIVQNNTAQGNNGTFGYNYGKKNLLVPAGNGADAEGGGIWTNGTVTLEGNTIIGSTDVSFYPFLPNYPPSGEGNKAIGGNGGSFPDEFSPSVVQGGVGGGGFGGGLYQAGGSVTMTNATVVGNVAAGGSGGFVASLSLSSVSGNGGAAAGGGVDVAGGTLLMSNDTVKTNFAHGGTGGRLSGDALGGTGGTGSGGGIYVGGGTVTLQAINLSSNRAIGGWGGEFTPAVGFTAADLGLGGNGLGGGLYVGGGVITMTGSTVNGNAAYAGGSGIRGVPTGSPGVAASGGISIVAPATVSLDAFTVTNTTNNGDYNSSGFLSFILTEDDIDGSYTLI